MHLNLLLAFWCTLAVLLTRGTSLGQDGPGPWATYRGNPQRTGNTDGIAGPVEPKVLWLYKTGQSDQYVASPVPAKANMLFAVLGPFNRPTLMALPAEGKNPSEPAWVKSAPYLKLPTVGSPAISDNAVIFGDGMHQTDGAVLHCLPADGGFPLWELPVPGELVHMEGAPTLVGGRAFIGAGAAGVLCVDWQRATLDGKEYGLDALVKLQQERWKELAAKYEAEKKKDPSFAVPPSEDQLHKPAPRLAWQQGKGRWHVDAPVNVVGDKVLVCSAFLDKEKTGDRAVHCLKADTGEPVWSSPLTVNPWGGATVAGDLVLVSTSTINYDPKLLRGAKGEVVALGLADGKVRWKKEFPGGVLGCVAIGNGLGVFTCTDGKVRALSVKEGERRLLYDAKAPFFAPAAVVADVAYVADLKGVVHAVDLKTGSARWRLDLGAEPVKAAGSVYGGVVVHGGRLYVATANLAGDVTRQPTVAVCIGGK